MDLDNNIRSNNDINMLTKIWGPPMWISLHSISFSYPINPTTEDKENYKKFFELVGEMLPCVYCKESYKDLISSGITKLDNQALKNRESLTKWLYDIHEEVNKKLGVDYGVSFDDVVKRYESYRSSCKRQKINIMNDPSFKGCDISLNKKTLSFKIANNKECPIIPLKMAKHFMKYARMRGLKEKEFYILKKNVNRETKDWEIRNRQCWEIINKMRENGIKSIELEGKWKGLPTIEELKLIMRLSSNLDKDTLVELIKKLPACKCEYQKIYKLIK